MDDYQTTFEFYYDYNVRVDRLGRKPYGLTFIFWA